MAKATLRYRVHSSKKCTMWATCSGVDAVRAGLPSATRSGVGCGGPRIRSCTDACPFSFIYHMLDQQ